MAKLIVPTRTDGTQRYAVRLNLDGFIYALEFFWNARDSSWSFTISDANANLLLSRKIVLNWPLTGSRKDPALPPGEFMAFDTTGQNVEPGLADLGGRVLLLYIQNADLP